MDFNNLEYPVFLTSVSEPESRSGEIERWLEPELNVVWQQWQEWEQNHTLKEIPKVEIIQSIIANAIEPPPSLFDKVVKEEEQPKELETKSNIKINEDLEDLFL